MLCSHCLGLVLRAVIRATQCCLTVPHYYLFAVLLVVTVMLFRDIFCCFDTQYNTDQIAVSTVHMTTILMSVVWLLSADDGRESGEG